ncbi:UNVERIFIED_CONTAM: hypothetical protein BEN50_14095 [Euhalothece sp. KZN 001]
MPKKIPDETWEQIYQDYLELDISYEELAQRYGVSATTIQQKATKQKWIAQKKEFRERLKRERKNQSIEIKKEKFQKIDETFFMLVQGLLYELCQTHRKRLEDGTPLKASEATQIATAIKTCYEISKDMEGDVANALQILMQNNVLPDGKVEEIIEVLNEGEVEVKRKITGILSGDNLNAPEYQLPSSQENA